jgi:chromosome segregation ATPase
MGRKGISDFDYKHTCPAIDKGLDRLHSEIYNYDSESFDAASLYDGVSRIFEDVRATNVDMRNAAEKQISDLANRIEDLESELDDKSKYAESLEDTISDLRAEIQELKSMIKEPV